MSNQELDKRKEKSQGRGGERTEPEPHCSTEIRNALTVTFHWFCLVDPEVI